MAVVLKTIISLIDVFIGTICLLGMRSKPNETRSDSVAADIMFFIAVAMLVNIIAIWTLR